MKFLESKYVQSVSKFLLTGNFLTVWLKWFCIGMLIHLTMGYLVITDYVRYMTFCAPLISAYIALIPAMQSVLINRQYKDKK